MGRFGMKSRIMVLVSIFFLAHSFLSGQENNMMDIKKEIAKYPVQKKILKNGMTVLVRPVHHIPKVSIQVWYNVGSKDEKSGEKGIAHLIEHMIFKGTDTLSESDINTITHMLSGGANAFTSYDYTGYLFNMPTHHWKQVLPILADCMSNVSFKDDQLNSEMKAVIQELKMYRDSYHSALIEEMMTAIFPDHPYHHPIVGYKQDLWSVHGKDLRSFYKKHYLPNNATLVVVGDVEVDDVFSLAEEFFGKIPANADYKKEQPYFNREIGSKTVTIYRDVQQPLIAYAFVVPGIKNRSEHVLEISSLILGEGRSSRLQKRLLDELQLVTSIDTAYYDLFDHALFFIMYEPKELSDCDAIDAVIKEEIAAIATQGPAEEEVARALKKAQMKLYSVMEDSEKQAYSIGKYFLATGDENYVYNYLNESPEIIAKNVQALFADCLRPTLMNKGLLLPLSESEKPYWLALQKESDDEDKRILSERVRNTPVEDPRSALTTVVKEPSMFNFPKPEVLTLDNGLKVFYYNNENTPKINVMVELKAKSWYDPDNKQGLYNFVASMLTEGTENYTATEFAQELESRGMSLSASPGYIAMSMTSDDFEKGLELLEEVVSRAKFDKKEIEKVRAQLLADIKNFWDEPKSFAGQVLRETIYKGHPYSKDALGKAEVISKIKRTDLVDFYKQFISPDGAKIAIVGDLKKKNVQEALAKTLGSWQGPKVEAILFPELKRTASCEVDYPINRDQVVLCYAGLSIDRKNPEYDKCLLFDQIFGHGTLGNMNSRLFELRERTGLFYTINGTLLANADEQPGMMLVKTIVSLDRLKEAEKAIKNTIDTVADSLTPQELQEAKLAILNSLMYNFESNGSIARAFLFLDKYNLPVTFFDQRAKDLVNITLDQVKVTAKKMLQSDSLLTLRIGRVEKICTEKNK
jgi:zinc protease